MRYRVIDGGGLWLYHAVPLLSAHVHPTMPLSWSHLHCCQPVLSLLVGLAHQAGCGLWCLACVGCDWCWVVMRHVRCTVMRRVHCLVMRRVRAAISIWCALLRDMLCI